jgi:hypothetical protein
MPSAAAPYAITLPSGETVTLTPTQLVDANGAVLGTVSNPLNIAGGSGGSSGVLDVSDRASRLLGHVMVDNWVTTQPISGSVDVSNFPATQPVSGPLTDAQLRAGPVSVQDKTANTLGVTATGAAAAAVTATLPAPGAGLFQYLEVIEITMYSSAARTGSATPVVVTSTNLSGATAWTFPSAGAIGTVTTMLIQPRDPIKAAAANTAVTIVCPATASVIWRVNVFYGVGT